MKQRTVLIVDDEIKLARSIGFALRQVGFDCLCCHNGQQGLAATERQLPDLVLLDVRMPGASGLEVLQALKHRHPHLPVIMMSALDATQDAVQAVKLGAFDYLSKPFDMDDLIHLIGEAIAQRVPAENPDMSDEQPIDEATLLGSSTVVDTLRAQLEQIASSGARCVYLQGEVGVGKAVVARELHRRTRGSAAPLVELNCATLSPQRAERELFGEQAQHPGELPHRGMLEITDGGSLFLHEVEALPDAVQARLSMYLEAGHSQLPADANSAANDVQLIISSHHDLSDAVQNGRLRPELYLKLCALPLQVPPLRQRDKDIELLARRFAQAIARRLGRRPVLLQSDCVDKLRAYDWPGNVRELKNLIEQLTVLHAGQEISAEDLPETLRGQAPQQHLSIEERMHALERGLVRDALGEVRGRKGQAAERLGISRHALKRKMQKLGLQ